MMKMKNRNTEKEETSMKFAELTDEQLDNVAGGVVSPSAEVLRTLKGKVVNAANDTNTDVDRTAIQKEIDASIRQIDDNALTTFNGKFLNDCP